MGGRATPHVEGPPGLAPAERAVQDLAHRGGRPAAWAGPRAGWGRGPGGVEVLGDAGVKPFRAAHSSKIRRMMGASAAFDSVNLICQRLSHGSRALGSCITTHRTSIARLRQLREQAMGVPTFAAAERTDGGAGNDGRGLPT